MSQLKAYAVRLGEELEQIETDFISVLNASQIDQREAKPSPFAQLNQAYNRASPAKKHIYQWARLAPHIDANRIKLLEQYVAWYGLFLHAAGNFHWAQELDLATINSSIESLLTYRSVGRTPHSINEAIASSKATFQPFKDVVSRLAQAAAEQYILVPDTNFIIDNPDITLYGRCLGQDHYTVVVVATVVAELDELKYKYRNDKQRASKISAANHALKRLRSLGDTFKGVSAADGVLFQMVPIEPNFGNAPGWLNKTVGDDRVVVSALEIQFQHPDTTVILLTNDLGMQNKAELAKLPYVEWHSNQPAD